MSMFNTLIDIDREGNILIIDKGIVLMPTLYAVYKDKNMGSGMVRWIVSVEDYKSIYRQLPMTIREERAMDAIFSGKNAYCTHKKVKEARLEYRKIQYDPLFDQLDALNEKMYEMTNIFRNIKPTRANLDELNDLSVKMEKSALARQKLQKMITESGITQMSLHGKNIEDLSFQEEMLNIKDRTRKSD